MSVHRCDDYDAIYGLAPRFIDPRIHPKHELIEEPETKVLTPPEPAKPRKGRTVKVK